MSKQYEIFKARMLSDPDVRQAYDALAPEFELARELIGARSRAGLTQEELAERMGEPSSDLI